MVGTSMESESSGRAIELYLRGGMAAKALSFAESHGMPWANTPFATRHSQCW